MGRQLEHKRNGRQIAFCGRLLGTADLNKKPSCRRQHVTKDMNKLIRENCLLKYFAPIRILYRTTISLLTLLLIQSRIALISLHKFGMPALLDQTTLIHDKDQITVLN